MEAHGVVDSLRCFQLPVGCCFWSRLHYFESFHSVALRQMGHFLKRTRESASPRVRLTQRLLVGICACELAERLRSICFFKLNAILQSEGMQSRIDNLFGHQTICRIFSTRNKGHTARIVNDRVFATGFSFCRRTIMNKRTNSRVTCDNIVSCDFCSREILINHF
ncbi:hypothetical protein D3C72_1396460 [compost metagenome]